MAVSGPNPPEVVAWPQEGLPPAPPKILAVRNLGAPVTVRPGERSVPSRRGPLYKPLSAPRSSCKPRAPAEPSAGKTSVPFAPSRVFLCFGLFMLGMLVLLPAWNALALKRDEAYMFFLGSTFPDAILALCLSILAFYALTIGCLARFGAHSGKTWSDDSMLTAGGCFVMLLGLALFAVASPMRSAILAVVHDIWSNCRLGPSTRDLVSASASLQALRAQPACAGLASVELCAGFTQTPAATALKVMEREWKCSGFCYEPPSEDSSAAAFQAALNLPLCVDGALPPCETIPRPRTLFSLDAHSVSCDGTAARDIGGIGTDVVEQLLMEGAMLVTVPVLVGFLRVFGSCIAADDSHTHPPHYGGACRIGDHNTA